MTDRDYLKILSEACALAGYAVTCQTSNRKEWMEGLERYLNRFSKAVHDTDIVKFNGTSFDVIRKEYQE